MTDTSHPRRWTVIASGLLCAALATVVFYTKPRAFFSPLAMVVVAAIGLAAVLLQIRLRDRELGIKIHPPLWLSVLGILFSLAAFFSDVLHLPPHLAQVMAMGAVGSFGISGALILHSLRKHRIASNDRV